MNMQVSGLSFFILGKQEKRPAQTGVLQIFCGFIHKKIPTVEKTVDKFDGFNGFSQVFHRNPKAFIFYLGKAVENSNFWQDIP